MKSESLVFNNPFEILKLSGPDGNRAHIKAIKIVMAEISKEVSRKFKIHHTYYTLVLSILPASIFCLAKTFLRHDERCIKHIDHDLMNSRDVTHRAHQTSDETMIMAIALCDVRLLQSFSPLRLHGKHNIQVFHR